MKNKKKISTSKIILVIAFMSVLIYTVAAFVLQFRCGQEISPTLTEAFFNACMVELVALATIKNGKLHKGIGSNESYEGEDYCEEEE